MEKKTFTDGQAKCNDYSRKSNFNRYHSNPEYKEAKKQAAINRYYEKQEENKKKARIAYYTAKGLEPPAYILNDEIKQLSTNNVTYYKNQEKYKARAKARYYIKKGLEIPSELAKILHSFAPISGSETSESTL
jgi:hypothetical protein